MPDVTKLPEKDPFGADIQLIDACMNLAAFGSSRFDARRSYEWKISLSIWALLVGTILHDFTTQSIAEDVVLWVVLLLFLVIYWSWLTNMRVRHKEDANITWHFFNEAQKLISRHGVRKVEKNENEVEEKAKLRVGRGRWGIFSNWAFRFQFIVTAFLILIVALRPVLPTAANKVTHFELLLNIATPPSQNSSTSPPTSNPQPTN